MANSDKNIIITPSTNGTDDPKIVFSGADATTGPQNITLKMYPINYGTISFEGSAGQLFSISNDMTGTIYSVNDISGIPSIEVIDTGLVKLAQYSGNVLIGTGTDNNVDKVQVNGSLNVTGPITAPSISGNAGTATKLQTSRTINGTPFDGTANITISDTTKLPLTGGDISGPVKISGAAGTKPLRTRGITGLDASYTADGPLYLQYGVNQQIFVGTAGTYNISADGSTYSGNAATATKLQTSRTIALTGGVTGSASFDGSANVSIAVAVPSLGVANGIATLDSSGKVPSTQLPSYVDDILEYDIQASFPVTGEAGKIYVETTGNTTYRWSGTSYVKITSGEVSSVAGKTGVVTLAKADVGLSNVDNTADSIKSVASAAKLTTTRTIATSGDATWSVSFDGSANVSGTLTLASSGATAGTYKAVTVDTKGRVTAGVALVTGLVTSTSTTGTSNVVTTNTNTYLNVVETVGTTPSSAGTSTQISGSGTVTVTSDAAGKLTITGAQNITGNAGTSTKLSTPRKINGVNFDGSADISLGQSLSTAVDWDTLTAAGTYGVFTIEGTNRPDLYWGTLDIFGSDDRITQLFINDNDPPTVWVRMWLFDYWTSWSQLASTDSNVASATKLETARTINGVAFDGTANITVADSTKAPLASPTLTGTPKSTTAVDGTNTTQIATTAFVQNTVGGYLSKTGLTGGTITLTDAEVSNAVLYFAGALTSNLIVVVPVTNRRLWAAINGTTGAFTLTVKTSAGTGVTVAQGKRNLIYTDGTTVQDAFNDFDSIALTGIPTSTTAASTTNTTQVATTAFVQAVNASDTGSAATAVALKTARTINGVSFNGTANITVADATKLPLSGGTLTGTFAATAIGITNTVSTNGVGLSLYGGANAGMPGYGIAFSGTATFGTHGAVTSDWATYFTMNGATSRGWIFKSGNAAGGNIASISAAGAFQCNGAIVAGGDITAFSDARLKTEIEKIANAVDKIKQLNGYTYTRIDSGKRQTGLIAQELEKVLPEAVVQGADYKSVAYGNIVGLLVEAIKELEIRISLLENK